MGVRSGNSFFYRMLCGLFIGISIIAPGISGSIMAVMLGIYDDLIDIISNPFKNFKRNFFYALPMGIGAALSILLFLQLLNLLFEHYPTPAYLLFISLIAGSLPTVLKEAGGENFKPRYLIGLVLAFAFALTIGMLARRDFTVGFDTTGLLYLSACGAIAGATGMIPGMSVSMMLMMLGVYQHLLKAAAGFDIITIAPVGACFVVGMVLFSNLTKFIFRKYHSLGYCMVLGFMSGSIISIFPALPRGFKDWALSAAAVGIGLLISFIFKVLGRKFNSSALN